MLANVEDIKLIGEVLGADEAVETAVTRLGGAISTGGQRAP